MSDKLVVLFRQATRDLELAELTHNLMSGVREIQESDRQTLRRIVEEYKQCKYFGKPIPGSHS